MIGDPFTFPAADLLAHLNQHVPGAVVMGGMASGGLRLRQSRLFLDSRIVTHGAVGAYLPRAEVHPLVAQGCRPVGDPYTITRADGNLIYEVGGRPALARLRELAAGAPDPERDLLAQGAHVGIVINEYQAEPRQGDFLVRGIAGADPGSGAIAVGEEVEVGQTVQFHLRDAHSADEDLRRTLEQEAAALGGRSAAGALLFTCTGRGTQLFLEPDHDTGLLREDTGRDPARRILLRRRTRPGWRAELPAHLHRLHCAVPGHQPLDALQSASRPFGSGQLFGHPADPGQAGQGGAREDFADVMQRDDQFLDPVQRRVLLPAQQDTPVFLGRDGPPGELDLLILRAEQSLDGGVQSQGEGGQLRRGEGALAAFGLMDSLPAPRPFQVLPQGLAQVGQRQLPLRPKARDLPSDGLFDPHSDPFVSS